MSEAEDFPRDILLSAANVVVMLPPFHSIEKTSGAVDRIAQAILAERNACIGVLAGMIKYGGSANEHGVTCNPYADLTVAMRAIRNRGNVSTVRKSENQEG